ncbi:MAG: serine/threonine-protein kinase, partial [Pirellula sp.]
MNDESLIDDDFSRLLDEYDLAYKRNELDDFWGRNSVASDLKERVETAHAGLRTLETFLVKQTHEETPVVRESNLLGTLLNKPVQLDRFEVNREIGRGGFGIVYLANDPTLNRQVAIKIPRIEMLGTKTLQNRFAKEAEIAAGLDHMHIVPVFEVGTTIDGIFIVSLYCPGRNLAQWLLEHPNELNCKQIVELMICLTEAMAYCHHRGVLHRDIKPANVLLFPTPCGSLPFMPRLNDFGLAKVLESSMSDTASSVLLGTPLYMSPEQASSQFHAISPATDVYSLGTILYELLTGASPFHGAGIAETLDRIRTKVPDAPRCMNSDIPRDLETLCLKCLAKQPADRYPSAQTLLNDLRAFIDGKPISARRLTKLERLVRW